MTDDGGEKPRVLLVIDDTRVNWEDVFRGSQIGGRAVRVVQTKWQDLVAATYGTKCYVDVVVRRGDSSRVETVRPEFVLFRQSVRGLQALDYRNSLYALMLAQIPGVNTPMAVHLWNERAVMFAELLRLQTELGHDEFPVIDSSYYPDYRAMLISPSAPLVVKVGHAHAGYGKILLRDHHQFEDLRSVLALHHDYAFAEPFIDGECDLRIQKIGSHYRVFERRGNNWKTNTGTSVLTEVAVTDRYRRWADAAAGICGGLDILAVDVIRARDSREYIIEVNDCTIGLSPHHLDEDHAHISQLVLQRWREADERALLALRRPPLSASATSGTGAAEPDAAAAAAAAGVVDGSSSVPAAAATASPPAPAVRSPAPRSKSNPGAAATAVDEARPGQKMNTRAVLLLVLVGVLSVGMLLLFLLPLFSALTQSSPSAMRPPVNWPRRT